MPYSVSFDEASKLITFTLRGKVDASTLRESVPELLRIAKERGSYLILTDAREMKLDLLTVDIYDLPKFLSDLFTSEGLPITKFKRAFVVSKRIGDVTFHETVSRNRGHNVKVFEDMQDAKRWLLQG